MYKLLMSNFLRNFYTKKHRNRLIFDRVIGKITRGPYFVDTVYSCISTKLPCTVEAVGISDVVLLLGRVADAGRQSSEVERFFELHELTLAVVNDRPRRAAVHSHRHVLAGGYQLDHVPRTCQTHRHADAHSQILTLSHRDAIIQTNTHV